MLLKLVINTIWQWHSLEFVYSIINKNKNALTL
jgi:hypothetical protein